MPQVEQEDLDNMLLVCQAVKDISHLVNREIIELNGPDDPYERIMYFTDRHSVSVGKRDILYKVKAILDRII